MSEMEVFDQTWGSVAFVTNVKWTSASVRKKTQLNIIEIHVFKSFRNNCYWISSNTEGWRIYLKLPRTAYLTCLYPSMFSSQSTRKVKESMYAYGLKILWLYWQSKFVHYTFTFENYSDYHPKIRLYVVLDLERKWTIKKIVRLCLHI